MSLIVQVLYVMRRACSSFQFLEVVALYDSFFSKNSSCSDSLGNPHKQLLLHYKAASHIRKNHQKCLIKIKIFDMKIQLCLHTLNV